MTTTTSDKLWTTLLWLTITALLAGWAFTINPWALWPTLGAAWLLGGGATHLTRGWRKLKLVFARPRP